MKRQLPKKETMRDLSRTWKYQQVYLWDVVVLLHNYLRHHEKHGNMDATRSYQEVKKRFNTVKGIDVPTLEALLYCSNILNEEGEFWHPEGLTFEEWMKRGFPLVKLDRVYNFVEEEEK